MTENDMIITECFELFPVFLEERLSRRRKTCETCLEPYGYAVSIILAIPGTEELQKLLDAKINIILQDAEIYYEMSVEKMRDAINELSHLATVYLDNPSVYNKITSQMRKLMASVPHHTLEGYSQPSAKEIGLL